MTIVTQLLRTKGNDVWSVSPDASIFDALKLMAEKNIGAVLVLEGEDVAGIFSERDYARRVVLKGKSSRETAVREAMTSNVISVRPDQTIQDCMTLMSENRFRHLPVISNTNDLVGLISIGDVVRTLLSEQEMVINQLEQYIKS